jgi:hypothetical protein
MTQSIARLHTAEQPKRHRYPGRDPWLIRERMGVVTNRTDDFLANGEHAAQKFLFATFVKAGKTILFEPDGIVVKEDVASITIQGPNVDKF